MKYLIYSDPHFCQYSSIVRSRGSKYTLRLENLIQSISWAEHLAEEQHCDRIIIAGDFFDKPEITAEEATALLDVYFSYIPHTFIVGNHEANSAKLEFSPTRLFERVGADIITEPTVISVTDNVELYFLPYLSDSKKHFKDYMGNNNKKKVVISHNDIAGIQYGKFKSSNGFDVNEIKKYCSCFINGHLHNSYSFDNIVLVGNLTGQNFNENAQAYDHYALVLEIVDNDIYVESFVNPNAFNFYKLQIKHRDDIDILNNLKPNSVLSIACPEIIMPSIKDILTDKDVVAYRLNTLYYESSEDIEVEDFTVSNPTKQFVEYAHFKYGESEALNEELSLLYRSTDEYSI